MKMNLETFNYIFLSFYTCCKMQHPLHHLLYLCLLRSHRNKIKNSGPAFVLAVYHTVFFLVNFLRCCKQYIYKQLSTSELWICGKSHIKSPMRNIVIDILSKIIFEVVFHQHAKLRFSFYNWQYRGWQNLVIKHLS